MLFSHERPAARLRRSAASLDAVVGRWNRRLAAQFDAIAVTSAFAEDELTHLGVRGVRCVPLGVDLDTFRPRPSLPDNDPARLVYAGRLSPERNPGAVIEAVKLLVRDGIDVRLDVYGTGGALPALRRTATGLPVVFHGHVSDRSELARRLSAADVAFAPSAAETFGRSVLEALACGTPGITANTGGARELLSPGAGVAVPATPAGIAARGRAERFPWSATVDSMVNLHATVADDDVARTGKTR